MKLRYLFIAILLTFSSLASAEKLYRCIQGGKTIITNHGKKGCTALSLPFVGLYSMNVRYKDPEPITSTKSSRKSNSKSISSPNDQRISNVVQSQRDEGRLKILQRELDNEQQALIVAQKRLTDNQAPKKGESKAQYAERLSQLQGMVLDHEENVKALQKEIAHK